MIISEGHQILKHSPQQIICFHHRLSFRYINIYDTQNQLALCPGHRFHALDSILFHVKHFVFHAALHRTAR